ncbi:Ig-like domain-containing protein [Roseateles depolymerans]|uniref:Ig-like domain-containing protein n=1 Tax=Roseateles depolymerans TaxID=76731 RepID=UPI00147394AC|nr:Ig-like domain-containing protein [Roseateles depolymerans]
MADLPRAKRRAEESVDDSADQAADGSAGTSVDASVDTSAPLAAAADAASSPVSHADQEGSLQAPSAGVPSATLADLASPTAATAETTAAEDDDRHKGLALWALGGAAGIGGIVLMAGGKSSSHDGPASGPSPVGEGPTAPLPGTPGVPSQPGTGEAQPSVPDPSNAAPSVPDPTSPTQPPVATPPRAGHLKVQLAADTGRSAVDGITADAQFQLAVIDADPGTTVRYEHSLDGGRTWQDNTGLTAPWPDGTYLLRAVVNNGAAESVTASVPLTLDTQAPATAELLVSGRPALGLVNLAMSGVEAGATQAYDISLDQGRTWHRTKDALSGLLDGDYLLRGVVTDAAGNQSFTAVQSITVDTTAPAPIPLQLRKVGEQGWDALSPLSSTGAVDLKLALPAGVTAVYQQSTDGGHNWTTVPSSVSGLAEGNYSFRAILRDAAGNETALDPVKLTVDKTPLPGLSISAVMQNGQVNGTSSYLSRDGNFQIMPDRTDPDAQLIGEFRVEGTLAWSRTDLHGVGMLDGRYEYRAGLRDPAGNITYSNTVIVEVDTRQPGAGTITLGNYQDTGRNASDRISTDDSFTLVHVPSGPVTAIQWQQSFDNGVNWSNIRGGTQTSLPQTISTDGHYVFRALVTDDQGQVHTTRSVDVTVDAMPGPVPTLSLTGLDDTGASSNDFITQDGRFTLTASGASPDATTVFEVSFTGNGGWLPTSAQQDLPSGTYWFKATSVEVGGALAPSKTLKVVVDRDAPAAAPLQLADFDDTGAVGDRVTSDASFTLTTPPLEAGATVRYLRSTDDGLSWSPTDASQQGLADGDYWFRTEVTDLAGNTRLGAPRVVTVDTQAPDAGALSLTVIGSNGVDLQWAGAETPDTLVYQVSLDHGQTWQPVSAHSVGLAAGDYVFRAVVTDAAGNAATTASVAWQVAPQAGDVSRSSGAAVFGADPDAGNSAHALSATEALWVNALSGSPFAGGAALVPPVAGV